MYSRQVDPTEFYNFMMKSRYERFATICSEEEADFSFVDKSAFFRKSDNPDLFIKFESYSGQAYTDIINQTKDWTIKIINTESWDPLMSSGRGDRVEVSYKDIAINIAPEIILVKDGVFVGLLQSNKFNEITCGLIGDDTTKPILFHSVSGFGSSDHDMMYIINSYLVRKDSLTETDE